MSTKCPKCNTENTEDSQFCKKCATALPGVDEVIQTKTLETPTEELTRGSVFAGRYEIIEELGKGGMGRVYRVEDKKIKKEIALKLIKSEIASDRKTIERFKNELTTARAIRHKNICGMFDLGEEKGQHYITMEYVSGGDLKRFIRRAAPLNIARTVFIAKQICEGLEEAHSLGIVHRDLKPNNIMIDDNGNARIMDFGIARTVKGKGITGSGVMIGTPEYMSPEQFEAKEVDQQSDIYSLGIILYEMLTGRLPFEGDTPFAIGVKHKSGIPEDPKKLNPQIPQDLSGLILKCLEKDKENRYQGAKEIRSDLELIEQGLPTTDRLISKKKTLTSREITVQFSMKKIFIPGFIIVVIVAVGLMIWSPWKRKETTLIQSDTVSIAVLPFRDLSLQKDQGHLCEGMTIEIIEALSGLQGWKVMNMISMLRYKDSPKDPKEIGQELDVKAILLGSVRREDEDVRINVQLVNVEDNFELWSEMYQQKLEGIFTIQSDIAEKIAKALETEIVQVK